MICSETDFLEVRQSHIHVDDSETDETEHKDITGGDCKVISGNIDLKDCNLKIQLNSLQEDME